MTAQGIVFSQSRSVWASLLFMIPVLLIALWLQFKSLKNTSKLTLSLLLITTAILLLQLNRDILIQRVTLEQETYAQLLSGDYEQITSINEQGQGKNVGIRLLMFKAGIDHWLDNPFIGNGPAASKILLRNSDDTFFAKLNDWHNGPVDILVRFGLTGLLLLSLCLWLTILAGWRAYRNKQIKPDLFLFLACGMTLILLSMLTNFRMLNNDWRYWMFLFSGAFASYELHRRVSSDKGP
jgi:O-antigen ligase